MASFNDSISSLLLPKAEEGRIDPMLLARRLKLTAGREEGVEPADES
jgi:hypothetical protein